MRSIHEAVIAVVFGSFVVAACVAMHKPRQTVEQEYAVTPRTVTVTPTTVVRCEEDMPCWDCRTMGNRICGPGH